MSLDLNTPAALAVMRRSVAPIAIANLSKRNMPASLCSVYFSAISLRCSNINQVGGTFDFTSNAGNAFYNYSNGSVATDIFSNAGLLEDTASGNVIFGATLLNTGAVSASQGALYLKCGGCMTQRSKLCLMLGLARLLP